jgi:hypothetical protein
MIEISEELALRQRVSTQVFDEFNYDCSCFDPDDWDELTKGVFDYMHSDMHNLPEAEAIRRGFLEYAKENGIVIPQ